jgi:DNA (cytosine-5)-methyltransferase 1
MKQRIKVIDLFAGPGGLGEGFASVGPDHTPTFKIAVSVEKEASAHKTLTLRAFTREFKNRVLPIEYYQYLRGEITKDHLIEIYPKQWGAACNETLGGPVALGEDNELIHSKISEALGENKAPWVLIGGPPCQAYSLAGRARNAGSKGYVAEEDGRHFLYKEYLDIIKKFTPTVFVMENVKGILSSSPTGVPIFDHILGDLKNPDKGTLKYNVFSLSNAPRSNDLFGPVFRSKDFIIKAEEYGVPQARHRVILFGVRSDVSVDHAQILLTKAPEVSVEQVLNEMPILRSGLSKQADSSSSWQKITRAALTNAATILNINAANILKQALPDSRGKRFTLSKRTLSQKLPKELEAWLADDQLEGIIQHETRGHMQSDIARYSYVSLFGSCRNRSPLISEFPSHLLPAHKNVHSGKFVDRFKSQLKGAPSKTITSHIAKDSHAFIHFDPIQSRGLTVREAARIQTFPENYFFEGNRTQQYVQVGNAVPPFLSSQIGNIIAKLFDH